MAAIRTAWRRLCPGICPPSRKIVLQASHCFIRMSGNRFALKTVGWNGVDEGGKGRFDTAVVFETPDDVAIGGEIPPP